MKDYIEERAVEIAKYIIETRATVRQAAKKFGISKSTAHKDCTDRLVQIRSRTGTGGPAGAGCEQAGTPYQRRTCNQRKISASAYIKTAEKL